MPSLLEEKLQAVFVVVLGVLLLALSVNYNHFQIQMEMIRRRRVFMNRLNNNGLVMYEQQLRSVRNHAYCQEKRRKPRKIWAKKRSSDWWDRIVLQQFTTSDWLENFRMSKENFMDLCNILRGKLSAAPNFVRSPIPVEKKVAVALYKLASCCEYRVVANQFGIHKSSVHNIIYSFCLAIIDELGKTMIKMPSEDEAYDLAQIFELKCGIPQVIGAIDGTHIPILAPTIGYQDFVNRKGWPSYNIQAVVDVHYRFRDVTCKHPGSSHDAAVLTDSFLYKNSDKVIPKGDKVVNGKKVPFIILGDPAYPLLNWLMKGFRASNNMSREEESFNAYLSKGRIVVENTFGRLKGRWRCLLKRNDISFKFMPNVIITCCILHNFIEVKKEIFITQWLENVREAELQFPQPTVSSREVTMQGHDIQNSLKVYMAQNFPLLQSRFH